MCGIIGAASKRNISQVLLEGLRRLEYRGYDSAGIAIMNQKEQLQRIRVQGKVQILAQAMLETKLTGLTGIGHTRWATHGKPSEKNAHPHVSSNELALVHNGIIENHAQLRTFLAEKGYVFTSETDTEVAAHLVHWCYQQKPDLLKALQMAAQKMQGAFAIGVIHLKHPHELAALRQGSPLVLGIGIDEHFIASDPLALKAFAQSILFLAEGDSVLLKAQSYELFDAKGQPVTRQVVALEDECQAASKGNYRHFMLKEIFEQPTVLAQTLEGRLHSHEVLKASLGQTLHDLLPNIKHVHIVACGTSYHAGLIARFWLESLSGISTQVEIASEYRYRDVIVNEATLFVVISQSGETADTLAALKQSKTQPYLARLAVCNIASSTMVREADTTLLTRAGREIGVASTKAFTTQLAALLLLATALCPDKAKAEAVLEELQHLSACCEELLTMSETIKALAPTFIDKRHALFLGRGVHFPVALEGALKLKEISYIHAEGYPAAEMKHGPIALID
ncbi:MAG TPA: glutamine--fructose-6-phosphate transaminase (isomerizing), partial [Legionellales bacterium]|nr:glutamine--fructose-6-phosphate transaminase (isomerizing) [Legionellales bacterium]